MTETENQPDEAVRNQPAPGAVITPGEATPATPPSPEPTSAAPAPTPTAPAPQEEPKLVTDSPPPAILDNDSQGITWTASEFVHHDKSASWYGGLVISTVLLAGLIFLITKDAVSVAVVIIAGLVLGIYSTHRPRQLEYRVDQRGVFISNKYYSYDDFKSFSVVSEGAFSSIVFMPLKRFAPALTIYYAPEDEESIMALLADQLPFEEPRRDAVDSLMRRIRF